MSMNDFINKPIEAVIFDLDGVIVSTDNLHYRAWKKIADEEDIFFNETVNTRLRGISRMGSLEIILEYSDKIFTDEEKVSIAERKNRYYVELLKSLTIKDILPGVNSTLTELKKRGIKVAIGSSSKNARNILKAVGLLEEFDAISDGNDITHSKPDPEVFLLASEKLGILPENCTVVEDAVSGIQAATAAGMTGVAIGDARSCRSAMFSIDSLEQLIDIVLK